MGRKTWDSIPPKFRPLKGRLNIVISRSFAPGMPADPVDGPESDGPVEASSLEMALAYLKTRQAKTETKSKTGGRVFVIGGAQIYAAALGRAEARRVLLTRVKSDFACDTFFPIVLGGEAAASEASPGWVQRTRAEHAAWIGEELSEAAQTENGIEYEFQMWEKLD